MFNIERVGNIHIFTDKTPGGFYNNVSVIEEESGLTIIDTFKKSETMKSFIEAISSYNKPIKRVIFTHWHIDHTLGAYHLPNIDIYSSRECRDKLVEFKEQYQDEMKKKGVVEEELSVVIPNRVIETEVEIPMEFDKKLLLKPFPGHSYDGMLIEYDNTLFVGDNLVGSEVHLILPPAIPPDAPKSRVEDLIDILNYIENKGAEVIIYGHGLRVSPQEILSDNRSRLKSLMEVS